MVSVFQRGTLNADDTAIVGSPSASQSWTPDALGNFTNITTNGVQQTRTSNQENEITGLTYDANGNLTNDGMGDTLTYDAWNHLVEAYSSQIGAGLTYHYDGLGRLISGTTTPDLYYSSSDQVLEEDSGGVTQAHNVWSVVYVNALVLRDQSSLDNGVLDQRLYVQQDANWNVTALVDADGTVLERFGYLPYGTVTGLSASWGAYSGTNYAMPYLWQGMRYDSYTNLYFADNRVYSPELMAWLQGDPTGLNAGNNVYEGMGDGPTDTVDPSGLASIRSVVLENGKILLYYMSAPINRPVFGKYTGRYIGVFDPATSLVTRRGYSVDLATVEGEVNSSWTTTDWDSWFKEHAADLTPYTGKNMSIAMGAWQNSRNDIARGVQLAAGLVKDLMWYYALSGTLVSSSRSACALSNWAKASREGSVQRSLASSSKFKYVPPPDTLQGMNWQNEGISLLRKFNGNIKFINEPRFVNGVRQFGGYDPVTNTIHLYRDSDSVTLFEELLHWKDLESRMARMKWNRATIAEMWASPQIRRQLRDVMEAEAMREMSRFGFQGK